MSCVCERSKIRGICEGVGESPYVLIFMSSDNGNVTMYMCLFWGACDCVLCVTRKLVSVCMSPCIPVIVALCDCCVWGDYLED